ncbi:YceI-like domain-containing protein [Gillisia sp. Hel_I_86]|uniref:YceI family protein n=1 Tax=Gillisia sp. Hel_I_86 TaxID=1249981 RepID=UPI00119A0874|nr:YceI family protein [Gillisia sp. Hel_I_86]TVZ26988.1 YceI-like domain-containing protein [Gillisia sp. Hel_I_86]
MEVLWKGSKMGHTGKHQGKIQLQKAYFLTKDKNISGGGFMVDMQSIEVIDIPMHEPIPRKRLVDHLKSDDFFDADAYPTSHFEITNVEPITGDSLKIKGNLTIKNTTKNLEFLALYKDNLFSTKFTFDRFQWDIAYKGNWIDRTFVDREIELTVMLKAK